MPTKDSDEIFKISDKMQKAVLDETSNETYVMHVSAKNRSTVNQAKCEVSTKHQPCFQQHHCSYSYIVIHSLKML